MFNLIRFNKVIDLFTLFGLIKIIYYSKNSAIRCKACNDHKISVADFTQLAISHVKDTQKDIQTFISIRIKYFLNVLLYLFHLLWTLFNFFLLIKHIKKMKSHWIPTKNTMINEETR